jgi:hypothetical protein
MLQLEINEAKQELRRPTEMPSREIASSGYGEKEPALSLRASMAASAPAAAMTFLVPQPTNIANSSRRPVVRRMELER